MVILGSSSLSHSASFIHLTVIGAEPFIVPCSLTALPKTAVVFSIFFANDGGSKENYNYSNNSHYNLEEYIGKRNKKKKNILHECVLF